MTKTPEINRFAITTPQGINPNDVSGILQDVDGTFGTFEIVDGYRVQRKPDKEERAMDGLMLSGLGNVVVELLNSHRYAITDAVAGSPVFSFALSDTRAKDDRQTAQLVPKISNYPVVEAALREQAEKLAAALETSGEIPEGCDHSKVVHTILVGLNYAIRQKLEEVESAEIILTKVNSPKDSAFISPKDIKKIVRRIKQEGLSDEEAVAKLITEIQLIEGFEAMSENEKQDVMRDIELAVHDGRELFKHMVDALMEIITDMMETGEITDEEVVFPELNDRILSHNAFKLLGAFFNGHTERNARDFNDIQSILILAYALFKYRRHPLIMQALKEHGPFTEKLTTEPFFERSKDPAYSKIYTYRDGNYIERTTKRKEETGFITIETEDGGTEKIRVKIDGTNVKEDESILKKAYGGKFRNVEVGGLRDLLRGRFVLWDINLKNFHTNMDKIRKIAIKSGTALGLDYADIHRKDLKPGQFCFKEPAEDALFKKCTLYGMTESGVPIEIQFIPKDIYELRTARSPLDHEAYKKGTEIENALSFIPYSVSPISHRAGCIWLARHKASRAEAAEAMTRLTEQPESDIQ